MVEECSLELVAGELFVHQHLQPHNIRQVKGRLQKTEQATAHQSQPSFVNNFTRTWPRFSRSSLSRSACKRSSTCQTRK